MTYPIRKITGSEVDEALALALDVFMEFEAGLWSGGRGDLQTGPC